MPSVAPTTKTASHSRPLAACRDASVTPFDGGRVLRVGPLVELGDEVAQRQLSRVVAARSIGQPGQRGQRLPALTGRAAAGRRLVVQPLPDRTARTVAASPASCPRRPAARARRAAQQQPGLADLRPVEEALAAAQQVGHPGVGERLLVGLGLAVGAEQHGDLAASDTVRRSASAMRRATRPASAVSSVYSRRSARAVGPLRDAARPGCAAGRAPARACRWRARRPAASSGSRGPARTTVASGWRRGKPSRNSGVAPAKE